MPPPPINSEPILLSFLCGSLVLSFLLAALSAVFKVYRPLVPVGERLRRIFANDVSESETTTARLVKTRVELLDNGFQDRESVLCGKLGMAQCGCGSPTRVKKIFNRSLYTAYPMPVA